MDALIIVFAIFNAYASLAALYALGRGDRPSHLHLIALRRQDRLLSTYLLP